MRKLKDSTEPQEATTSSEEELLFPDDEDVIEYINELTQEAIEEQKCGEKFYSLEELQREILRIENYLIMPFTLKFRTAARRDLKKQAKNIQEEILLTHIPTIESNPYSVGSPLRSENLRLFDLFQFSISRSNKVIR